MNELKEEELVAQRARELREDALDDCLRHIQYMAEEIALLTSDGSCGGAVTSYTIETLRTLVLAAVEAHATEKEAIRAQKEQIHDKD